MFHKIKCNCKWLKRMLCRSLINTKLQSFANWCVIRGIKHLYRKIINFWVVTVFYISYTIGWEFFFCANGNPCFANAMLIVSCDWQVKPAPPPCGTTTLGPISMATPQRWSLPSSSRTSSTPFSLRPASSPSWGNLLKGQRSNIISKSLFTRSVLVTTPTCHMVHAHNTAH